MNLYDLARGLHILAVIALDGRDAVPAASLCL